MVISMISTGKRIINGEKMTLAFLGDSVTQGCFEFVNGYKDTSTRPEEAFHSLLKKYIKEKYDIDVEILNAGVSGNFSKDGLARLQQDVIDKKPDFCCVMFGTNDVTNSKRRNADELLKEYSSNMRQIAKILIENQIEVVFMTPTMLCTRKVPSFKWFWGYVHSVFRDIQNSGKMDLYVEAEKAVAKELNIPVADAYAVWKELAAEGVDTTAMLANGMNHPTPEAHNIFKEELIKVLFG